LTVRYRSNGTWDVTGGSGAAVDDFASALAGCVLVAKREEPPARLPPSFVKYCGMTGRLLDYSGSVPESLSERFERRTEQALSLRALETPPTAMTLGIILSPEVYKDVRFT